LAVFPGMYLIVAIILAGYFWVSLISLNSTILLLSENTNGNYHSNANPKAHERAEGKLLQESELLKPPCSHEDMRVRKVCFIWKHLTQQQE